MNWLMMSYLFVLGSCLGSFFNVVGLRIPKATSFVYGRSQCTYCKKNLYWNELIPIISFLFQKGRCKGCNHKISGLYPFIELLTGLLFVFSFLHYEYTFELIIALFFISLLMIVLVTDISYMIIPNSILLCFLPVFLFLRFLFPLSSRIDSLYGGLCGLAIIALIIVLSRGAMGAGDMKLLGLLGIVLGWDKTLLAFFIAVCAGACFAYVLLLQRRGMKEAIPFAPYLAIGALTSYFYGELLIRFYLALFVPTI